MLYLWFTVKNYSDYDWNESWSAPKQPYLLNEFNNFWLDVDNIPEKNSFKCQSTMILINYKSYNNLK